MTDALMLGKAFKAGCAFAMGRRYAERLAQDSDKNVKFRTTDNGNIIAIKDGEVELTESAPEKAVKSFQEYKKVEEEQFNQAKQLTEGCLDGMKK